MSYIPTVWRERRAPAAWNDVFGPRSGIERFFDRFFLDAEDQDRFGLAWAPVTDVREDDDGLHVNIELPGMTTKDVSVTVEDGVLTISGEKKQEKEEGDAGSNYHLVERRYGRFERNFRLPSSVNADKVKAKFDNGVLNIEVPKSANAKRKQIEIK